MDQNDLLEPIKLYNSRLKQEFHDNADKYYEELAAKAQVDKNLNALTCDKLYEMQAKLEKLKNKRAGKKALLVVSIIFSIIGFIAGIITLIVGIGSKSDKKFIPIIIGIVLILGCIAWFVSVLVFIRPKIKDLDKVIAEENKKVEAQKNEAINQMAPLNDLFDWGIPAQLVNKTTPLIQMDKTFNPLRFQQLHDKYDFGENDDEDVSSVFVQSGHILGNPFLIERNYVMEMVDHVYTGSITITWTETVHDDKGSHTVTRSQVLTAEVIKPRPEYFYDTWLVYGNDAASKLKFSRQPSNANSMSDKEIEKYTRSFEKELDKMHEKAVKKNKNFTPLGNTEFEALFHALDRDNEVEFRLLFTPLAQKSMLDIIKSKKPYGDDFIFEKNKCLNYIKSKHSQTISYDGDPRNYVHFDIRKSKEKFMNYMDNYFQGFFYDLAPLLSVPLYQQHKAVEFIYKDTFKRNVTSYETEVMANRFERDAFMPENCDTNLILKSCAVRKAGGADIVDITSHGFHSIPHTTFVTKWGRDGRAHQVPVTWYEFDPVSKHTPIQIQPVEDNRDIYSKNLSRASEYINAKSLNGGIIMQRGIFSSILTDEKSGWNAEELNKILSHKEE